ncbi:MAG: hypothetical protein GY795_44705, partial [Desulfobacterales bacterium]|nr:hypothetical protein [Desulfobacterales bacterium]
MKFDKGKGEILFNLKDDYFGTGDKVNKIHAVESARLFRNIPELESLPKSLSGRFRPGERFRRQSLNDRISVSVPAGTFGEDTEVTVTEIGEQGLPFPLPLGWNPVCAVHIGPDDRAASEIIGISFIGPEFSEEAAAARWDAETREWTRLESAEFAEKDGVFVPAPATGTVALILPDSSEGPAVPGIGKAFCGSAPKAVPDGAEVSILSAPETLFVQAGTQSEVRAVLTKGVAVLDLGRVTLENGIRPRLIIVRRISRTKKNGRWRVRTFYYGIA